ncbi:S-adenosyl-L-methionine-dependent methyltransferase [Cercophora newfieldiana]|uniref:S-adenosyl-L-methionine-dependent methyltransferase n=1 Tax=Cercophora newfieldiana TaxID=92897 RepID=A0AA39YDA6_9PEZI|nr:S-adenosyl-L-methionine-dependent methyltransferase [Cercophora newfieldiana]
MSPNFDTAGIDSDWGTQDKPIEPVPDNVGIPLRVRKHAGSGERASGADAKGDQDSALGSDLPEDSPSTAATSTNGNRPQYYPTYHRYKEGKYVFPNDKLENERLDLQHYIFSLTYRGRPGLCPKNDRDAKVHRVLDVGSGTGSWAVEFADEHPEASVVGVDLSPIQLDYGPPTLTFYVDDIEEEWVFESKFDYIHSRMMSVSLVDWDRYLHRCYDNLEPGGHLELAEVKMPYDCDDGTVLETHAHMKWVRLLMEASERMGRPFVDPTRLKEQMEAIGFQDVQVQKDKWPMNPWPKGHRWKELGAAVLENFDEGLESFSYKLCTEGLGWTKEEVDELLVEVRKNIHDRSLHLYITVYTIYGRKPDA